MQQNYFLKKTYLPLGQTVENLTAMQEVQVWSLGLEDPLEKGTATHSSIASSTFYKMKLSSW